MLSCLLVRKSYYFHIIYIITIPLSPTWHKQQQKSPLSFSPSLASLYLFEQWLRLGVMSTSSIWLPLQDESLYVFPNCKSLWIKASAKWLNVNVNVTQLVPGLMKARLPKNEMCCDWLAVPVRCDWRTAYTVFQYCPAPCQNSKYVNIAIIQTREYWTRGSRRTFARTDIARHFKVVMFLLLFFFWLNHVLDRMSTTA